MPIIVDQHRVIGNVAREVARLQVLATDLGQISSGRLPTAETLAGAPLLDPYWLGGSELPILIGGNIGHPLLDAPVIKTSEIWVYAPTLGWARTRSRFYRLGRPAVPFNGERPNPVPTAD